MNLSDSILGPGGVGINARKLEDALLPDYKAVEGDHFAGHVVHARQGAKEHRDGERAPFLAKWRQVTINKVSDGSQFFASNVI